jgi:hypothetical protein
MRREGKSNGAMGWPGRGQDWTGLDGKGMADCLLLGEAVSLPLASVTGFRVYSCVFAKMIPR